MPDFTYTVVILPNNGSLSGTAPALTYTPNTGFTGDDSFSFIINDGAADSDPATVTITINLTKTQQVIFIHTDLLGSPVAESDNQGKVIQ